MEKDDFNVSIEEFEKIMNLGMDDLMEMLKENPRFESFEKVLETSPEEKELIKAMFMNILTSTPTTAALFTHLATETLINIIIEKLSVEKKKEREEKDESSN